jgi:hypothetical protein
MKKQWTVFPSLLVLVTLLSGCASVRFSKLESKCIGPLQGTAGCPKNENFGVPFYEGRPYLLVTKSVDSKGVTTLKADLISLPDYTRAYRAYARSGFGSATVDLTLGPGGVLTATKSSASNTDSLAGILGLIPGLAGLSSAIGLTESQTLLNEANAAQVQSELMSLASNAATLSGTTLSMLLSAPSATLEPACPEPRKKWRSEMKSALATIGSVNLAGRSPAAVEKRNDLSIAGVVWYTALCSDPGLEEIGLPSVDKVLFAQRLALYVAESERISTKEGAELLALLGCEQAGGTVVCEQIRGGLAQIESLTSRLRKLLPSRQPQTIVQLFKLYDEDGKLNPTLVPLP